jgi:hypothetical protein
VEKEVYRCYDLPDRFDEQDQPMGIAAQEELFKRIDICVGVNHAVLACSDGAVWRLTKNAHWDTDADFLP